MSSTPATYSILTDDQVRELIRQAQNGDSEAREQVIIAHLPLAKNHAQSFEGYGVPFEDLYQEACYGLLLALGHYSPDRKESFTALAKHYIDKSIRGNALQKQNSTIPSCYQEKFYYEIKNYIAGREQLMQELKRTPTDQEMADYLDVSLFSLRRIRQASAAFLAPSTELDHENYTADTTHRPVEEAVLQKEHYLDVYESNVRLTPREIEVLERRCGFNETREPQPWAQISAEMNLHEETLRLCYRRAIAKYRKALGLEP